MIFISVIMQKLVEIWVVGSHHKNKKKKVNYMQLIHSALERHTITSLTSYLPTKPYLQSLDNNGVPIA